MAFFDASLCQRDGNMPGTAGYDRYFEQRGCGALLLGRVWGGEAGQCVHGRVIVDFGAGKRPKNAGGILPAQSMASAVPALHVPRPL